MQKEQEVFKPLAVVTCPHCGGGNTTWNIVCHWCHQDLEPETQEATTRMVQELIA